jgi:Holliday junction resolvase
MGKNKDQGTAFETELVKTFAANGFDAGRYPEGGANDIGDVWFDDGDLYMWVVEAKATERLNVTRVLAKAKAKAEGRKTALIWKRLVKGDGKRRVPDGEKVVVVIDLETFLELLQ